MTGNGLRTEKQNQQSTFWLRVRALKQMMQDLCQVGLWPAAARSSSSLSAVTDVKKENKQDPTLCPLWEQRAAICLQGKQHVGTPCGVLARSTATLSDGSLQSTIGLKYLFFHDVVTLWAAIREIHRSYWRHYRWSSEIWVFFQTGGKKASKIHIKVFI